MVIFVKNKFTHKLLNSQSQQREIKKTYLSLVHSFPLWNELIVDFPIRINSNYHHRIIIDRKKGEKAFSIVEIIRKYYTYSDIKIIPQNVMHIK